MSPPFADAFLSPRQREQFRSDQLVVLNGGSSGANCSGSHPEVLSQSMVLTRITGARGTGLSGGQRQRVGLA